METLEIQGSVAPFNCSPRTASGPWVGVARIRCLAAALLLVFFASFSLFLVLLDGPLEVLWLVFLLAIPPLWRVVRARMGALAITVDRQTVSLKWRESFRQNTLSEPLSAYSGVARWSGSRFRSLPLFTWRQRWWVVTLVHKDDPQRSVPLVLSGSYHRVVQTQRDAAKALDLPVLLPSSHGGAWRPRPHQDALEPLQTRLRDMWSSQNKKIILPLQGQLACGGLATWAQTYTDRWLWLLILAPFGIFYGGFQGFAIGLTPAILVAAILGVAVSQGDRWSCDGSSLVLSLHTWWGAPRQVTLPVTDVLLARLVAPGRLDGTLDLETAKTIYRLRLGATPAREAQNTLESLLLAIHGCP